MDKLKYTIKYVSNDTEDKYYSHDKLPLSFTLTEDRTLKMLSILDTYFDVEKKNVTDEFISKLEEIAYNVVDSFNTVLEDVVDKFEKLELKEEKRYNNVVNSDITFGKDYYTIKVSIEKDYVNLYVYDLLGDDSEKYILNLSGLKNPNTNQVYMCAVSLLMDLYNFTNTLSTNLYYDVNKLFSK